MTRDYRPLRPDPCVAASLDLSGNVIPDLHAEGRLRGVRLTVE